MKQVDSCRRGFTFIELLVAVGVIVILIAFLLSALNPIAQIKKAQDARRKRDLSKMKTALEDYYNDHDYYPATFIFGSGFQPYLAKIPTDPVNEIPNIYYYATDGTARPQWFKIYAYLRNPSDPAIEEAGCASGCGPPPGEPNFNYWVASSNVSLALMAGEEDGWIWPPPELPAGTPTSPPAPTSTPVVAPTNTPVSPPTNTPIPTPTATSTPDPGIIFADSFESGNLGAWDATETDWGDLSVSASSAYTGGFGLQVMIDDANSIYARDYLVDTGEYYVRVYINPNGITLASGPPGWSQEVVFLQLSDSGSNDYISEVGIRANSTSGYDIRMIGQNDSRSWDLISDYLNITDDWHLIEMIWRAASGPGANDGYSELIIDGISRYSKADRDTDTYLADRATLGAIRNILSPANGTIYFDDFYSANRP